MSTESLDRRRPRWLRAIWWSIPAWSIALAAALTPVLFPTESAHFLVSMLQELWFYVMGPGLLLVGYLGLATPHDDLLLFEAWLATCIAWYGMIYLGLWISARIESTR